MAHVDYAANTTATPIYVTNDSGPDLGCLRLGMSVIALFPHDVFMVYCQLMQKNPASIRGVSIRY